MRASAAPPLCCPADDTHDSFSACRSVVEPRCAKTCSCSCFLWKTSVKWAQYAHDQASAPRRYAAPLSADAAVPHFAALRLVFIRAAVFTVSPGADPNLTCAANPHFPALLRRAGISEARKPRGGEPKKRSGAPGSFDRRKRQAGVGVGPIPVSGQPRDDWRKPETQLDLRGKKWGHISFPFFKGRPAPRAAAPPLPPRGSCRGSRTPKPRGARRRRRRRTPPSR